MCGVVTPAVVRQRAMAGGIMLSENQPRVAINSHFLSIVAHDLRNPIQILKLNAELLKHDIKNRSADKLEARANSIWCICENVGRLLNSLLDACDSSSAELPIKKQNIDLANLAEAIVSDYSLLSMRKGVSIILRMSGCDSYSADCDSDRIRQVLGNLLDNAIKYSSNNDTILMLIGRKEKCLRVSVANKMANPRQYDCPLLFQKNFVFDAKSFGSRGLGLFISKLIVEAHGGKIWANVSDDTFRVFFDIPA